ncbi:cysteine desulfurase family protein [Thiomicrorhabdus sp. ZW0627]|uniref:cysteine desulfurase family protein n=1 Tax=Thiomicrorhabdus sp. ZW0627 TaxID=3039774 RepID=UPI002436D23C|nr:cysteine desulfurase family protein [Thiomicrorhabdus sp. ZW0627]MDG6774612.1 cysteine desulfurase family protein [Thiomicrorhabdus sp. ZW0627]
MLYLDYAASTPVYPEVVEEMRYWFEEGFANPSSNHTMGLEAKKVIDEAREFIADEIGCYPSEIIFTSGATEANNLALKGYCLANQDKGKHIITSSIEHKCVLNTCAYLETQGFKVTYLPVKPSGHVDPLDVKNAIRPDTILCSIMTANNELGTVQPIQEIGKICFDTGVKFHTDAAQAVGKMDIDIDEMNLDFLSMSAHKFNGPKGIGALFIRDAKTAKLIPVIHGAGQELSLRGGSLPTPLIVGMHKSLQYFKSDFIKQVKNKEHEKKFKETLNIFDQRDFVINGTQPKLPNIYNLSFKNLDVNNFIRENFDQIALSQGSACSSKEVKASHVLKSIGIKEKLIINNSLRISF